MSQPGAPVTIGKPGTVSQLSQLQILSANVAAANAAQQAAFNTYQAAKVAALEAAKAYDDYRNFYFGNTQKSGVVSGATTDVT